MYRRTNKDRLSLEDFCLRLDSKLSSNNRWMIMEKLIPWDEMEDDYAAHFCKDLGPTEKEQIHCAAAHLTMLAMLKCKRVTRFRQKSRSRFSHVPSHE